MMVLRATRGTPFAAQIACKPTFQPSSLGNLSLNASIGRYPYIYPIPAAITQDSGVCSVAFSETQENTYLWTEGANKLDLVINDTTTGIVVYKKTIFVDVDAALIEVTGSPDPTLYPVGSEMTWASTNW